MTTIPADELSELAKHVLAFEHERARHDRTKEAEIRVEFDMSPARYYQVLNRVIDSPAALAYDPQLVGRLQRLRRSRTSARAARSFAAPGSEARGVGPDARGVGSDARGVASDAHRTEEER